MFLKRRDVQSAVQGFVRPREDGESRAGLTRWFTAFMKRAWSSAVHTRRGRLCRPSALRESPLPPLTCTRKCGGHIADLGQEALTLMDHSEGLFSSSNAYVGVCVVAASHSEDMHWV